MKKIAFFAVVATLLFAMGPGGGMGKGMGMGPGGGMGQKAGQSGGGMFAFFDLDKDGRISKQEWQEQRQKRMQERAKEGRMLRNAANAPAFESIDKNGDGFIDRMEFRQYRMLKRQQKMQQRTMQQQR